MHDEQDAIESVTGGLSEARELLDAARKALDRLQDASGDDTGTIRHAAHGSSGWRPRWPGSNGSWRGRRWQGLEVNPLVLPN